MEFLPVSTLSKGGVACSALMPMKCLGDETDSRGVHLAGHRLQEIAKEGKKIFKTIHKSAKCNKHTV